MRITYLHQYFTTPQMAGGTRSYEMARRLVANGHEINMITSWREEDGKHKGWFETDEAGIRVHWLPVPYSNHMSYGERIRAFFLFAWAAGRKAASLEADVIFATSTPLTIALPGAYAKWRRNVPMVFEVRDLWPELPIAIGALKNPVAKFLAHRLERFAYPKFTTPLKITPTNSDLKFKIFLLALHFEFFRYLLAQPVDFLRYRSGLRCINQLRDDTTTTASIFVYLRKLLWHYIA